MPANDPTPGGAAWIFLEPPPGAGFHPAEVISYPAFTELGSEQAVKEAGLLQVEGKDYVVSAGDLMNIRFNV